MSNFVFPAFQRPNWNYTYPIKRTPTFSTITQSPASGRGEVRIPLYTFPRWAWDYNISYLKGDAQTTNSAWQQLVGFYMAVQGAGDDWLFIDPQDNTVTGQVIGTGDGSTTEFLFYRTVGGYLTSLDIVQNFQAPPSVYVGGTLANSSTYSYDPYGNLTFNTAPGAGQVISWSGSFYFRCHFVEDSWNDLQENMYQIWEMGSLKFQSVIL